MSSNAFQRIPVFIHDTLPNSSPARQAGGWTSRPSTFVRPRRRRRPWGGDAGDPTPKAAREAWGRTVSPPTAQAVPRSEENTHKVQIHCIIACHILVENYKH